MILLRDMTEPELRELLNLMCARISTTATSRGIEKPQFALLLFNDPEITQYVCNCERADVIKAMRETADRLERNESLEREPFGATGEYPSGKLGDTDKGGLTYGVAADSESRKVVMRFWKPVAWIGFNPPEARQLATVLTAKADSIESEASNG